MRSLFSVPILLISFCFFSCKKNSEPANYSPYYNFTIGYDQIKINACGSSDLVAEYLGDTLIYASFGCAGVSAGFSLKGKDDGEYILNNGNVAFYSDRFSQYATDSSHTGTLTIKRELFSLPGGGELGVVRGTFSFFAKDKISGKTIKIERGQFLLRKY